jgi:hypothetical protein
MSELDKNGKNLHLQAEPKSYKIKRFIGLINDEKPFWDWGQNDWLRSPLHQKPIKSEGLGQML